jgi:hypothetical protein
MELHHMMISVYEEVFLRKVKKWVEEQKEIFIVLMYAYRGGHRDYIFVNSYDEFMALLKVLPKLTRVTVFKEKQLLKRQIVDESLLDWAREEFQNTEDLEGLDVICLDDKKDFSQLSLDEEWLNFRDFKTISPPFRLCGFAGGTDFKEFSENVSELWGKNVAAGLIPDWFGYDNEGMISAKTPLPDGSVRSAPY